jgi:hypothetical protein
MVRLQALIELQRFKSALQSVRTGAVGGLVCDLLSEERDEDMRGARRGVDNGAAEWGRSAGFGLAVTREGYAIGEQ